MRCPGFQILLLVLCSASAAAADQFDPQQRAKTVARFVDEQTIGVGRVDLGRIDVEATLKQIGELIGAGQRPGRFDPNDENIRRMTRRLREAGVKEVFVLVSLADVPRLRPVFVLPVPVGADAEAVLRALPGKDLRPGEIRHPLSEAVAVIDGAVVAGAGAAIERMEKIKGERTDVLAAAFQAAGETDAQLLLLPSDEHRRAVREMLPELPEFLGEASGGTIADGLLWAALGVNTPPKLSLKLVIQSKDAAAAKAFRELLRRGLKFLGGQAEVQKLVPMFDRLAGIVTPKVEGDRLVLALDRDDEAVRQFLSAAAEPLKRARETARRNQSKNNLKQLGIQMHNFHDAYSGFPPIGSFDEKGRPLLSWRVYVLPFVEQIELYRQFRLDEPWDSPHNKKLIAKMPEIFATPGTGLAQKGLANYLAPVGEKMIMTGGKEGISIREITDGTSNTIMLVEVDPKHAVVWTKPEDYKVDPKDPKRGLTEVFTGGFHATLCDGSVHFLSLTIDVEVLRLLFMRNDGKPIPRLY